MAYSYRNKVGRVTATFITETLESNAVEIEAEHGNIVRYEVLRMSLEEARDLQYLLGRLIAHAEEKI